MSQRSYDNVTGKLDRAAVLLSGLCLVHCLALPLIIALFPVFGFSVVEHTTFHQLILVVVIPTTVLALGAGYRRHRRAIAPALGVVGIGALVMAAFAVHALNAESVERSVTVAGGLLIAAAHIQNFRLTRAVPCHHHDTSKRAESGSETQTSQSS